LAIFATKKAKLKIHLKMKHLKIAIALFSSILILASCGGKKKDQNLADYNIEDYIKLAETIDPQLEQVDQVFNILDMVDAEYYEGLCNDPQRARDYMFDYPTAAANLGIMMADIIYHLYGENHEAMYLSFAGAQELARYIGVESEFASWTIESLEGTVGKRDTITMLFNELLTESEKYNSEKEMVFVHTAFLTGSFIEKVFISGTLLKEKMKAKDLTAEQEGNIRKLLVIYLNQLDPSTTELFKAYKAQQEQLSGLVILATFEKLKELSTQLKSVKSSLAAAPIEDIAENEDLGTTFDLIANLRNILVTASE